MTATAPGHYARREDSRRCLPLTLEGGLPTVRRFQAAHAEVTCRWLATLL